MAIMTLLAPGCDSCERRIVGRGDMARVEMARSMLTQVASQLDIFKLDHGRYPETLDDLIVVPNYVGAERFPPEGYLREFPTDGWGSKLNYRRGTSREKPFELSSYGADGREGGRGFDADISN